VNTQNPNGYLDAISNSSDALSGSINIKLAGGLSLGYSGTAGTVTQASAGILNPIDNAADTLAGSISIQVGTGAVQTVNMGDSSTPYTLAGLASAIDNANDGAGIGVNAAVVQNSDGSSSLSLTSGNTGSAGTLTVTSSIVDTSTQTIQVPTTAGNNTLAGLASAINSSHSGVTANVVTTATQSLVNNVMTNGEKSQLVLVSDTEGSSGALTVNPSITDTTTNKSLNYNNNESDINSLTTLGISVNNDGSLTLDTTSLDSLLNSNYSSVVGFFQNVDSWGQTFSNILTDSGTTAGTGILALASSSNSNIESTLNADISKENAVISAQQVSLTAELNSANEIMQQLPSQLDGVNELYSAITGYNQSSGG